MPSSRAASSVWSHTRAGVSCGVERCIPKCSVSPSCTVNAPYALPSSMRRGTGVVSTSDSAPPWAVTPPSATDRIGWIRPYSGLGR